MTTRKQIAFDEPKGAYLRIFYRFPERTTDAQKIAFAHTIAAAALMIQEPEKEARS